MMLSRSSSYTGSLERPESRKTCLISATGVPFSMATISTLGVRISLASMSLNSMALEMSSLCSSPIAPPASASSTMVRSSSSENSGSVFLPIIFLRRTLSPMNIKVSGVRITIRPFTKGARKSDTSSAYSLAMILGEISPSTSTRIVTITVAIVGPILEPHTEIPYTVATVVIAILEIVFPTSIVVMSLSKFSVSSSTSMALLLSSAARFFILILLTDENAVSVPEKNVEHRTSAIIAAK